MTPHGKANDRTHTQPPLVLAYLSYPDGGIGKLQLKSSCIRQSAEGVSRAGTGFARGGRAAHLGCHGSDRLLPLGQHSGPHQEQRQRDHDQRGDADQRAASNAVDGLHEKASVSVSCVALRGGMSCPLSNRARCRLCGQGERFEQVFEEILKPNDCRNSGASASRSGLIRRPTLSSRSASAARSARHSSTSPAIVSRLTKRSWRCSTSCDHASGLETIDGRLVRGNANVGDRIGRTRRPAHPMDTISGGPTGPSFECRSESNQRQVPQSRQNVPAVEGLRVGEPTRIGRLSWPALGRTSNVSELGVTSRERPAPNSSFDCAAPMRVMSCGVRIPLDPEGKPEANGKRPRRRNPRKFGRDRAERRSTNLNCKPEQLQIDGDRMSELAAQHVTSADVAAPIVRYWRAA